MKQNLTTAKNLFIMFLVKKGMSNNSVAEKIVKGERIITHMTGNSWFPTPIPTLVNYRGLIDALAAAEAAMDGSKLKTEIRNQALADFTAGTNQLQSYVETIADGNTEVALSSGFEVRNPATKPLLLNAPENVTGRGGKLTGDIFLKWKTNRKAKVNVIECTKDPLNGTWEIVGQTTKSSITISGNNPGQQFYFRVAHINAAGVSPWSDVVEARASY